MNEPNTFKECKRIFFDPKYSTLNLESPLLKACRQKFTYLQLVDLYTRHMGISIYLIIILILVGTPLFFTLSAYMAERFLALELKKLATLFKISQALSAVTLIAFAGSAPDIIASLSNSGEEENAVIITLIAMGVYVFGVTMIMGVITLFSSYHVKLPILPIVKEIGFSIMLVVLVGSFGIIGEVGYLFLFFVTIIYLGYIATSIYIDKIDKERLTSLSKGNLNLQLESQIQTSIYEGPKIQIHIESSNNASKSGPNIENIDDINVHGNSEREFSYHFRKSLAMINSHYKKTEELHPNNLFYNILRLCRNLTIPFEDNYHFKGDLILIPFFGAFLIIDFAFGLSGKNKLIGFFGSSLLAILFFAGKRYLNKHIAMESAQATIVIFVALAWIQIFISIIIDFINFISFYFSLDEIILKSFLLSSGTSIGELFGSRALVLNGAEIMATLSVYSGGFTNFVIVMILNSLSAIKKEKYNFDIFGLNEKTDGHLTFQNWYVIFFMIMTLVLLAFHLVYYYSVGFNLSKTFGWILIGIYSIIFVVSITLGMQ